MFTPRLILVTTPDLETARNLAKLVIENRLAACVNIISGIESHYRWEGKVESNVEYLLLIKSSSEQFSHLEELISSQHPYACPEILSLASAELPAKFRAWWEDSIEHEPPDPTGQGLNIC